VAGPLAAERPSDGGYPVNDGGLGLTRLRILTVALSIAMGLGLAMTAGGPNGLAGDPGSAGVGGVTGGGVTSPMGAHRALVGFLFDRHAAAWATGSRSATAAVSPLATSGPAIASRA
jgi:hypothetical protein